MKDYSEGCGKRMGHNESCSKGWMCQSCEDIAEIQNENAALKSKIEDSEEECGNHEYSSTEYANAAQMWKNKAGDWKDENAALKELAQRAISFLSVNGIYSDDLQEDLNKLTGENHE